MTFKEFMRHPNLKLDALVEEAERKRIADEESAYENYIGGDAMKSVNEAQPTQQYHSKLVRVCADSKHTHTAKSESG